MRIWNAQIDKQSNVPFLFNKKHSRWIPFFPNILPETLILQLHFDVPSTTCFSEDSRLSMCVSGFTLNTVLKIDKRARYKIHPPPFNVFAHHMRHCVYTVAIITVFELVWVIPCYDSPGLLRQHKPTLDNTVTNIHLQAAFTIGWQQHWQQVFRTLQQSYTMSSCSNLWQWFLQTTCWCRAKPSTLLTPWMFCAPQISTQTSPWTSTSCIKVWHLSIKSPGTIVGLSWTTIKMTKLLEHLWNKLIRVYTRHKSGSNILLHIRSWRKSMYEGCFFL